MSFHTLEHFFWAILFAGFIVGDTVTTMIGLRTEGVAEGHPLFGSLFSKLPPIGDLALILGVKVVFTFGLYKFTHTVPQHMQTAAVAGVALVGVVVTSWNTYILLSR